MIKLPVCIKVHVLSRLACGHVSIATYQVLQQILHALYMKQTPVQAPQRCVCMREYGGSIGQMFDSAKLTLCIDRWVIIGGILTY